MLRRQARPDQAPAARQSRAARAPGQDPPSPGPGRPRQHGERGHAGIPGQLLRRPSGTRPAGLLDLAGDPAPEPFRRNSGSHRPARRLVPAAGSRTSRELPRVGGPHHHPSSAGRRRQRLAWRTSRTASSTAPPARPDARSGRFSRQAPRKQAGPTGPAGSPCRPSRALRACKPPTIPSCGDSPARSASRGAGAGPFALPGGDRRTFPRSSPKTGTNATSRRSPMSAPYSPAARQHSGWSRWSPEDHSPKPRTSWDSHPETAPGPGRAGGSTHRPASSTPGPGSSPTLPDSRPVSGASPANSAILTCRWSTTSSAAGHCRTGASTSGPGTVSLPGCRPSHARICRESRGPQAPARVRLRLGPRHCRRANLRPPAHRGRPAPGCPARLATILERHLVGSPDRHQAPRRIHQPQGRT